MTRRRTPRDAEANLPEDICRICGTSVREGEGVELPLSHAVYMTIDGLPHISSRPRWRRAHARCDALSYADVVAKVLALKGLSKTEAVRTVDMAGVEPPIAFQRRLRDAVSKPWAFVTVEERKALREALGVVRKLDRGLERGVRDADHHRHALVREFDGAADQLLALGEAQIGVFLGLDAGGDHHGGAAILHDVVDLPGEARFIDLEVGVERGQWRND